MNKEFIPYEQALELKELGFNEECIAVYFVPTKGLHYGATKELITNYTEDIRIAAPLYQQAFRWFREKYELLVEVGINYRHPDRKYGSAIYYLNEVSTSERLAYEHSTYEEAELACLKKLIEITKTNNI